MAKGHKDRLAKNAASKAKAENDGQEWSANEVEWLLSWDGSQAYLEELAELLGRTIEACREKFYKVRRTGIEVTRVTRTTTTTTTTYRGWTEDMGDGWD